MGAPCDRRHRADHTNKATKVMSMESELDSLLRPLLRLAQMQLRNVGMAEDVVSETLLALLEEPGNLEDLSSLRAHAIGILKFKIIEMLRQHGREAHIKLTAL
jgi:RNA polymerase sigma-70 factor, ECF subfamily